MTAPVPLHQGESAELVEARLEVLRERAARRDAELERDQLLREAAARGPERSRWTDRLIGAAVALAAAVLLLGGPGS